MHDVLENTVSPARHDFANVDAVLAGTQRNIVPGSFNPSPSIERVAMLVEQDLDAATVLLRCSALCLAGLSFPLGAAHSGAVG